jgi:hypothetical protein
VLLIGRPASGLMLAGPDADGLENRRWLVLRGRRRGKGWYDGMWMAGVQSKTKHDGVFSRRELYKFGVVKYIKV